jgi:hypothetical protein
VSLKGETPINTRSQRRISRAERPSSPPSSSIFVTVQQRRTERSKRSTRWSAQPCDQRAFFCERLGQKFARAWIGSPAHHRENGVMQECRDGSAKRRSASHPLFSRVICIGAAAPRDDLSLHRSGSVCRQARRSGGHSLLITIASDQGELPRVSIETRFLPFLFTLLVDASGARLSFGIGNGIEVANSRLLIGSTQRRNLQSPRRLSTPQRSHQYSNILTQSFSQTVGLT